MRRSFLIAFLGFAALWNSVGSIPQGFTIDSYYDPSVEFLEVELSVNGQKSWKVYGPDLNGVYGGLQGIGGLEAVVQESGGATTAMISDHFGNIVATSHYNPNQTSMATFPANRYSAYGPVPGYQPPILSLNTPPAVCFGWLGKRVDETGRYNFGGREYVPDERRWLSYDLMGWGGGSHPYGFCNGSPGYFLDPDGRFGKAAANYLNNGAVAGQTLRALGGYLDNYNNSSAGGGWFTGLSGTIANELAAASAPSSYANALAGFGNNVNTIYQEGGLLPAASYAVAGWNVGKIYSGFGNLNLVTGEPVGDWYERGTVISSGVGSTAAIAAGGLGLFNVAAAEGAASGAGGLVAGAAEGEGANIALGSRFAGTRDFANAIGADHLLDANPSWKNVFMSYVEDPATTFHVNMGGFFGSTPQEMIMNEMTSGSFTGWELQQLQNAGRLPQVNFYPAGQTTPIPNPFNPLKP